MSSTSDKPLFLIPSPLAFDSHRGDVSAEAFRYRYAQQMEYLQKRLNIPAPEAIYTPAEEHLRGHRRLYFGPFGLTSADLQRRAADPRYAPVVEHVHTYAAQSLKTPVPEIVDKNGLEPYRSMSESFVWMSASILIDTDPVRRAHTFDALLLWVRAFRAWGPFEGNLVLAQSTIGLCTVYDWLYDELPLAERAALRTQIIGQARFSLDETRGGLSMWRGQRFAANHNWAHHSARAFAAFTLWGEDDATLAPSELKFWLDDALVDFWLVKKTHTHDGAPLEGPGYQDYGLRFYLDFISHAEHLLNMSETFYDEGLRSLHARLHVLLPGNCGGLVVADGFPKNWGASGSFNFRHLATRLRDPRMQLVAELLQTATGNKFPMINWRDLFVYDPDLPSARIEDQPTTCDLDDFGLFLARSGWDSRANFFALRCGAASGTSVVRTLGYDFGEAHAYPNQGSVFFYHGTQEVLPGVNYCHFKFTRDHNLVVFEGRDSQAGRLVGQLGEGGAWFNALAPTDPDSDYTLIDRPGSVLSFGHAEGQHHYLCELGGLYLLRDERVPGGFFFPEYLRSVIFLDEGVVVIVDRVRTPAPRTASFRLVTAVSGLEADANGFRFLVDKTPGLIRDFSPGACTRTVGFEATSAFETPPRAVAAVHKADTCEALFAVVLGIGTAADRLRIVLDSYGYTLTDSIGTPLRRVDWP